MDAANGVLERDRLCELVDELLTVTGRWFPGTPGPETPDYFVLAAGFLARCRALLRGMVVLVRAAADDSVGALYRPLLETYLSGVYVLLGEQDAVVVLEAALLHQTYVLDRALSDDPVPRPDGAVRLLISHRDSGDGLVERVDRLFAELNSDYADWAPRVHDHHYRVTSLHDVHGGLGALQGYIGDDRRVEASREATRVALHLLEMAFSLVLGLAAVWADRTGKSTDGLTQLHSRWEEARPNGSEGG